MPRRARCFLECRRVARKKWAVQAQQEDGRITTKPVKADKTRINEQIRCPQVRVIADDGEQLGIMRPEDALREAEARGLDLVEVAPMAQPPVCRLIDFGKYRYQQSKRAKEARKNQHTIVIKEIKYRPKISDHDFDFKTNHVKEFLNEGNKVKITIMFRGREMAHPEFGTELLQRIVEALKGHIVDPGDVKRTRLEMRNMTIVVSPTKVAG
jgi:translation initiation factor IF-3